MRSLLLFLVILISTPSALIFPHLGVLLWIWISVMNPHRLSWGISNSLPLVLIIASVTLAAWFFSKEPKTPPSRFMMWVAFVFVLQTTISSFAALYPDFSWALWDRTLKTFILFFVAGALINSRVRIQATLWILAISFGFFATNGLMATLSSGGRNVLAGPASTMLADNNVLACSFVMSLPVLNYLRLTSANKFVRMGLVFVLCFTLIAIITSYSRGSLIALAVGALAFLKSSKNGALVFVLIGVLGFGVIKVLPDKWFDRVGTLESVESIQGDASFSGRIDAWKVSYWVARDRPLTGGGFSSVEHASLFLKYLPEATRGRAAHSIYFQVLGDHGFIGLILYLFLPATALLHLRRTRLRARGDPKLLWAEQLAQMLQISILCFLVGGSALSMAYHDFILLLFVISMNLDIISEKKKVEAPSILSVAKSAA